MKRVQSVLAVSLLVILGIVLIGAVTITETRRVPGSYSASYLESVGTVKRMNLAWTATTTATATVAVSHWVVGEVVQVIFTAAGDTVTSGYDVELLNDLSVDLLQGEGANLTTTTTAKWYGSAPRANCSALTLSVGGTTGTGNVYILYK